MVMSADVRRQVLATRFRRKECHVSQLVGKGKFAARLVPENSSACLGVILTRQICVKIYN